MSGMMDWTQVTPELLKKAGAEYDLNVSLRTVIDVVDPDNAHDLGGEAAVWFSGPIEYEAPAGGMTDERSEDAWPHLSDEERTKRLTEFFDHIRKSSA
jgi:hypothetical protein